MEEKNSRKQMFYELLKENNKRRREKERKEFDEYALLKMEESRKKLEMEKESYL